MFSNPKSIVAQIKIGEGAIVGDFGAGEGAYAREFSDVVGEHGKVYAFDVQKSLVTRLVADATKRKLHNIHPLWVDLEIQRGTKLADATLDVALIANTLFQIEDKKAFISEVVRVLHSGGKAVVIDWKESFGHTGPHPENVVTESMAKELFTTAGLSFESTIPAGEHHYGLIFRKAK